MPGMLGLGWPQFAKETNDASFLVWTRANLGQIKTDSDWGSQETFRKKNRWGIFWKKSNHPEIHRRMMTELGSLWQKNLDPCDRFQWWKVSFCINSFWWKRNHIMSYFFTWFLNSHITWFLMEKPVAWRLRVCRASDESTRGVCEIYWRPFFVNFGCIIFCF